MRGREIGIRAAVKSDQPRKVQENDNFGCRPAGQEAAPSGCSWGWGSAAAILKTYEEIFLKIKKRKYS